jgi:hypothetical protein
LHDYRCADGTQQRGRFRVDSLWGGRLRLRQSLRQVPVPAHLGSTPVCYHQSCPACLGCVCLSLPARPPLPQVIVAERGPLVFVFNFSPVTDYEGLQVRPPASPACMIACIPPASLPASPACMPACMPGGCMRYTLPGHPLQLGSEVACAQPLRPASYASVACPALPLAPFPRSSPRTRVPPARPPAHPPAPACRCLCLSLASTAWCSTPMPGILGGAGGWATTWTTSQT